MAYCLDTSAFLDAWLRYYPIEVFPSVWEQLDALAKAKRIVAPHEVFREMVDKGDGLSKWAKTNKDIFLPIDVPQQAALKTIMGRFPKIVEYRKNKSGADPWVVAVAKVLSWTVVTGEGEGSVDKPKIPYVCKELSVPCMNLTQMFKAIGLKF